MDNENKLEGMDDFINQEDFDKRYKPTRDTVAKTKPGKKKKESIKRDFYAPWKDRWFINFFVIAWFSFLGSVICYFLAPLLLPYTVISLLVSLTLMCFCG